MNARTHVQAAVFKIVPTIWPMYACTMCEYVWVPLCSAGIQNDRSIPRAAHMCWCERKEGEGRWCHTYIKHANIVYSSIIRELLSEWISLEWANETVTVAVAAVTAASKDKFDNGEFLLTPCTMKAFTEWVLDCSIIFHFLPLAFLNEKKMYRKIEGNSQKTIILSILCMSYSVCNHLHTHSQCA